MVKSVYLSAQHLQIKKAEQQAKTCARMARHCLELCANAKCLRAHQYTAKHGMEAYELKTEKKLLKQIENSQKPGRTVHPQVPRPKHSCPDDDDGNENDYDSN
ncbi:hypothetical protein C8R43DRAFT_1120830 [Mycena crocata]|nr:hypothetical protein C8R43DRAFT_1120830 [Mycena crocata]